ncbi:MAG: XdhC family protein [Actinomycetota bacterium]|nr:XdhC family protein [Actinomycetota bacterium]
MTDVADTDSLVAVAAWLAQGHPAIVARVTAISGFSTWPGEELIAVDSDGGRHGAILGRPGSDTITRRSAELVADGAGTGLDTVTVEIHGAEVIEAGMSCGGSAEVLLQPAASIPVGLWSALSRRAPAALVTRIEGPTAGPASMVVTADGRWSGDLTVGEPDVLAAEAAALLTGGQSTTRRVEDGAGVVLIESWVPAPRLVVVGDGDLVAAIVAQAALLNWETRAAPDLGAVSDALAWAGSAAAVIILSHDPHLDVPALRLTLAGDAPYVGAMGSRRTQSRRLERLVADGVTEGEAARVHRPIGLDLGGRGAPEVALAIAAEILAGRCGRDGRSLRDRTGPIHDRPGS